MTYVVTLHIQIKIQKVHIRKTHKNTLKNTHKKVGQRILLLNLFMSDKKIPLVRKPVVFCKPGRLVREGWFWYEVWPPVATGIQILCRD